MIRGAEGGRVPPVPVLTGTLIPEVVRVVVPDFRAPRVVRSVRAEDVGWGGSSLWERETVGAVVIAALAGVPTCCFCCLCCFCCFNSE